MNENRNRTKTIEKSDDDNNKNDNEFIFIGTLGKTVGMDGLISVIPLTSFPERFQKLKSVFLTKERKTPHNLDVEKTTYTSNESRVNMKLRGIDSIEAAEKLRGYRITIPRSERFELPEDNFYIDQLIGCGVYDENDRLLGNIKDVMDMSANDIYLVDYEGKDLLIPAISEFVKSIDIKNKRIEVHLIDGMLPE